MNGKASAGRIFGIKHGELCKFEQRPGYAQLDREARGDYIIYGGPPLRALSLRPLLFSSMEISFLPQSSPDPTYLLANQPKNLGLTPAVICYVLHCTIDATWECTRIVMTRPPASWHHWLVLPVMLCDPGDRVSLCITLVPR